MNRKLCHQNDISNRECRGFEYPLHGKTTQFFVLRKNHKFYAYMNDCPHVGTPLNWENTNFLTPDGNKIICATHGALFRIEDGYCTDGPCVGMRLKQVKINCEAEYIVLEDFIATICNRDF